MIKDFNDFLNESFDIKNIKKNDKIINNNDETIITKNTEQLDTPETKPNGLWYSFNTEWVEWVRSNMPRWEGKYFHKIDINYSKILKLDTDIDIKAFEQEYGGEIYKDVYININWVDVAKKYSGIEMSNPYTHKIFKWHKGWDVPSGCIWDKDAIKSIKKLN